MFSIRRRHLAPLFLCLLTAVPSVFGAERTKNEEKAHQKAWKAARGAFLRSIALEDEKLRLEPVKGLKEFADDGAAELVVGKVFPREKNFAVTNAAVAVLMAARDPDVVEFLCDKASGRGKWFVRAPIVEALGSLSGPGVEERLTTLLKKEKDPRVLTMALFGVEQKRMKGTIGIVLPLLEHDDWQVRVAAIEALARFKLDHSIEPLIDALMNERGRLRHDLADALKKITGKDFGRDANKWRKWYHERGSEKEAEPEAAPPPEKNDPASSGTKDRPTYFGLRVLSERVVFVIDLSMSMKTAIDIDKITMAREAALTGKGDGKKDDKDKERFEETIKWWKIKDRLDLAIAQLKFVVKNLDKEQKFEIVAFSDTVKTWNGGRLTKASSRAKAKALQWIDQLEVEGKTAAGACLDVCFEMAGIGAVDKNYKSGMDTIFFLSDGAPSDRKEDVILNEVLQRNRLGKIRIHVVCIMNYSVRFLRLLAEQNKGIYKFFAVEDKK